jgi:excisionase family DNA binding protein
MRVDRAVAREVLERVQPFGIEAALVAMENLGRVKLDKVKQLENAIEQARFEAARARRQYDAVDPENRLVAADLERRWNQKLEALHALEEQLGQIHAEPAPSLQDADRVRLLALGDDLSRAWNSPGATIETRKKIVRLLISEIVVDVFGDKIALVIHWQGGDHTRLEVAKNKAGQTRWTTDIDIVKLIQVLARQMTDAAIAAALNRTRKFTGHGNGWTRAAVCSLRHQRGIAVYRDGERKDRGEMTLDEAAHALNVSRSTVQRMIDDGVLAADHPCPGAPRLVQAKDVERADIQQEAKRRRARHPSSHDPRQNQLDL